MLNTFLGILASILDQPTLQAPAAAFIAAEMKAKLPAGFEKDAKDLLAAIATEL